MEIKAYIELSIFEGEKFGEQKRAKSKNKQ